jgi:hypothetical protein
MSIIPFDSGRSYVVTSIPVKQQQYRFTDNLNRTEEERKFLEHFERIFYAAASGDLNNCQKIVSEGFCDFNAFSVGKFGTPSGESLDNVSPLQVAEFNKHQNVVDYFRSHMSKIGKSGAELEQEMTELAAVDAVRKRSNEVNQAFNESQPQNSRSRYYAHLNHEEKKIYDNHMDGLSRAHKSLLTLYDHAARAIKCSYNDNELKENLQALQAIENSYRCDVETIEFLKRRIEQPFNCSYAKERRIQTMALADYMETFNKS